MRAIWQLVMCCIAIALAACSIDAVTFSPGRVPVAEDCMAAGDEDGNGAADCTDPTCAMTCQGGCGDGTSEAGEACDDGNDIDGDGCDSNARSQHAATVSSRRVKTAMMAMP